MNIGYVGLGALGSELARRFLTAHRVSVWDMNPAACAAFVDTGAHIAASPAELASASDVILFCLPRSSDVRELIFGPQGLVAGMAPGKLLIDQTSGVPAETAAMADEVALAGIAMMDAAVSGSPQVVPNGGATLMLGGSDEVVQRALPVLGAVTAQLITCGSRVGDGQAMKLINNAANAAIRLGTLELTALGRKCGHRLQDLADRFNAGPARNLTTDRMLPALVRGEASTNFALSLMAKDLSQAVDLGMARGVPVPLASLTRGLLHIGLNLQGTDARLEDMVTVMGTLAGTPIAGAAPSHTTPDASDLPVLEAALASLCHVVTLECVTAGAKHGLRLRVMHDVLSRTSGWSAAGRNLLSGLLTGRPQDAPLKPWIDALRKASVLASRAGCPTQLLAAVQAAVESAAALSSNEPDIAAIAREAAAQAGVRFE